MVIISAQSLKAYNKYYDNKLKLKVIHFCPLDGREGDPKCKRIVITTDCSQHSTPSTPQSQQRQHDCPPTAVDTYLVIVFYGSYAKTPFKKSPLKTGQVFTLYRFETSVMPKNKVFKSNGRIFDNFFEPLVVVKAEFEPTIKWLVSLREEPFTAIADSDSFPEDNQTDATIDSHHEDNTDASVTQTATDEQKMAKSAKNTLSAKKRLRFASNDDELGSDFTSDEDFDTGLTATQRKRKESANKKSTNNRQTCLSPRNPNSNRGNCVTTITRVPVSSPSTSTRSPTTSGHRRHEYKTLIEVHNLFPVSGKTYCHIYGVLRYRDFKKNTIHLRDEKAFTSTIQLRPGNSSFRHYPAFRPGDIVRIHRVLLAPNCMDIICCDPKDVVVFEAFQDSQCFSPINTSVRPTFESFDRQRKEELDQWFADDLLADSLSEKKSSTNYHLYADLAVQVLRVTTTRDRTELVVWDTTPPALRTFRSDVSTAGMGLDSAEEELIRIVNENQMSIVVTVFEQHSNDAQSIKPFDFIVLFNVSVRADRFRDGFYMYALNSGYHFGKCIRFVKPNAYLSKRLYDKIEEYKVMSAVNVGTPSIEDAVLSQSFPADSQDVSTFPAAVDQSAMFSDMADFEMDLHEVIDELENNECYLPVSHIVDIPFKNILIDELISDGVDKHLYKVKARVINYLPSSEKRDVISVLCTNQDCHRMITLRHAITDDPLIESIIESSKDKKLLLNCLKCQQSSCVLVFKFIFILEDNKHKKLMAQLFGHNAELFLRATPEAVLQIESKWHFVERLLNYICARISSVDSNHSSNVLNYWILQPSKVDNTTEDGDVYIYQIRTAVAIETADKCIGLNLT
ncbi:unnamed protein product [Medioppia subpectinata]|uniref:Protection of telomeres protein 1 ssDNA-binding domain-containing protein n=1 Tax=Medioppia subpectinata TaxID=1979941 RepID=A0A7R9KJ96_9ACAR|nr:unnamed protein product [Medioppia subpectinata]CAG2104545.1 unnamed protein product [Medioppia subpectinata]